MDLCFKLYRGGGDSVPGDDAPHVLARRAAGAALHPGQGRVHTLPYIHLTNVYTVYVVENPHVFPDLKGRTLTRSS